MKLHATCLTTGVLLLVVGCGSPDPESAVLEREDVSTQSAASTSGLLICSSVPRIPTYTIRNADNQVAGMNEGCLPERFRVYHANDCMLFIPR